MHRILVTFSHEVGSIHSSVLLKDGLDQNMDYKSRCILEDFFPPYFPQIYLHTKGYSTQDYIKRQVQGVVGSLTARQLKERNDFSDTAFCTDFKEWGGGSTVVLWISYSPPTKITFHYSYF